MTGQCAHESSKRAMKQAMSGVRRTDLSCPILGKPPGDVGPAGCGLNPLEMKAYDATVYYGFGDAATVPRKHPHADGSRLAPDPHRQDQAAKDNAAVRDGRKNSTPPLPTSTTHSIS